jgi:hypothetical protein
MTEPDESENDCDCADKVPVLETGEFWTCPKCDAEWHSEDEGDDD